MKTNLQKYFSDLRLNPNHHLGFGDIRLTLAQQEELIQENMEKTFKKGDSVYWTDPDAGTPKEFEPITSGIYTVTDVNDDVLFLINKWGSEVEAFVHECKHVENNEN